MRNTRLLLCTLVAICLSHTAHAERRLALVLGLNTYDHLSADRQLRKAIGDARAVAATLTELGFDVTEAEDVSRLELNQLWAQFLSRINPNDIAAVYFSGHGVELERVNYLLPRDIPSPSIGQEELLKSESLGLDRLLDGLSQRRPRLSLIILDACRNNPFADARGKSVGAKSGLAPLDLALVPEGTFVMYAAGVGQMALDRLSETDAEPNSLFTRVLLPLLREPGLDIRNVARDVKKRVRDLALSASPSHQQTPAYYDELIGEFCFAGCNARGRPDDRHPVAAPAPLSAFRDCPQCPEMVALPAGSFMMGSDKATDPDHDPTEAPRHLVQLARSFAVSRFEVTFDEWDACVAEGGCNGYRSSDSGWGRGRRPVINVSWADAKAYVAWLSARTGKPYRLLSEAEWEYAARAGSTTRYLSGDDPADLCTFANSADRLTTLVKFRNHECSDRYADRTAPVGDFNSNAFELYDMSGNVWEWVEDCWQQTHNGAPPDGRARSDGDCSKRVIRGGSWLIGPIGMRSAMRAGIDSQYRDDDVGFRVARFQ